MFLKWFNITYTYIFNAPILSFEKFFFNSIPIYTVGPIYSRFISDNVFLSKHAEEKGSGYTLIPQCLGALHNYTYLL